MSSWSSVTAKIAAGLAARHQSSPNLLLALGCHWSSPNLPPAKGYQFFFCGVGWLHGVAMPMLYIAVVRSGGGELEVLISMVALNATAVGANPNCGWLKLKYDRCMLQLMQGLILDCFHENVHCHHIVMFKRIKTANICAFHVDHYITTTCECLVFCDITLLPTLS
jgi:hypothetical protein